MSVTFGKHATLHHITASVTEYWIQFPIIRESPKLKNSLKDNFGHWHPSLSYLLHLKADGGLHFIHLVYHVVRVSEKSGELASLAQARTQQPWDLLDETVWCQEGIVLLGYNNIVGTRCSCISTGVSHKQPVIIIMMGCLGNTAVGGLPR